MWSHKGTAVYCRRGNLWFFAVSCRIVYLPFMYFIHLYTRYNIVGYGFVKCFVICRVKKYFVVGDDKTGWRMRDTCTAVWCRERPGPARVRRPTLGRACNSASRRVASFGDKYVPQNSYIFKVIDSHWHWFCVSGRISPLEFVYCTIFSENIFTFMQKPKIKKFFLTLSNANSGMQHRSNS